MVKISVITWNGGFREYFHTIDSFAQQTLPQSEYEFIWVEYFDSAVAELTRKIEDVPNAQLICLNGQGHWHAGKCMNSGVAASSGDLLVIVDGDVVVKPNFLEQIWDVHRESDKLVVYVRRWDEPQTHHNPKITIEHLEQVCYLPNPLNCGGCVTLHRETFAAVRGYEEHPIIGGVGAVSKEFYTRLQNAGFPIVWLADMKVFHPWHPGTLPSANTRHQRVQAWVIEQRLMNLDTVANDLKVADYVAQYSDWAELLRQGKIFIQGLSRLAPEYYAYIKKKLAQEP